MNDKDHEPVPLLSANKERIGHMNVSPYVWKRNGKGKIIRHMIGHMNDLVYVVKECIY